MLNEKQVTGLSAAELNQLRGGLSLTFRPAVSVVKLPTSKKNNPVKSDTTSTRRIVLDHPGGED